MVIIGPKTACMRCSEVSVLTPGVVETNGTKTFVASTYGHCRSASRPPPLFAQHIRHDAQDHGPVTGTGVHPQTPSFVQLKYCDVALVPRRFRLAFILILSPPSPFHHITMGTWEPKSRSTSVASTSSGRSKFSPPGFTLSAPGYQVILFFWSAMEERYKNEYTYGRDTNDWSFFDRHVNNAELDLAIQEVTDLPGRRYEFEVTRSGRVNAKLVKSMQFKGKQREEPKAGGRGTTPVEAREAKISNTSQASSMAGEMPEVSACMTILAICAHGPLSLQRREVNPMIELSRRKGMCQATLDRRARQGKRAKPRQHNVERSCRSNRHR